MHPYSAPMPVIVIGADTPLGADIVLALSGRSGDVRAFVTDGAWSARFRPQGVRVAVGDVSDDSHVAAAALDCFSAVLVTEAASDDRERSFLDDPETVLAAWDDAVTEAGVVRAIWVGMLPPEPATPEAVLVETTGRTPADVAIEVAAIDDRPTAGGV